MLEICPFVPFNVDSASTLSGSAGAPSIQDFQDVDSPPPLPPHWLHPPIEAAVVWREPPLYPARGLRNRSGVVCYYNAVLQCLLHCPPLAQLLLDGGHGRSCERRQGGEFCGLCAFERHVKDAFDRSAGGPLEAEVAHHVVRARRMQPNRQHCANEFLVHFLDWLGQFDVPLPLASAYVKHKISNDILGSSLLNQIFGGLIKEERCCQTCGRSSTSYQFVRQLSLPVRGCSYLSRSLRLFSEPEYLDDVMCDPCGVKRRKVLRRFVGRGPNVLIIALERSVWCPSSGRVEKLQGALRLPLSLSLSSLRPRGSEGEGETYSFCGAICHTGIAFGGHYVAVCRGAKLQDMCFVFDDEDVRGPYPLDESSLPTNAYLVFYVRDRAAPWIEEARNHGVRLFADMAHRSGPAGWGSSNGDSVALRIVHKAATVAACDAPPAPTVASTPRVGRPLSRRLRLVLQQRRRMRRAPKLKIRPRRRRRPTSDTQATTNAMPEDILPTLTVDDDHGHQRPKGPKLRVQVLKVDEMIRASKDLRSQYGEKVTAWGSDSDEDAVFPMETFKATQKSMVPTISGVRSRSDKEYDKGRRKKAGKAARRAQRAADLSKALGAAQGSRFRKGTGFRRSHHRRGGKRGG